MISFGLTADDLKRIAYAGVFAFVGAFVTAVYGFGPIHDYSSAKAAALAAVPAAIAAGLSALKNGVLADTSKLKG